MAVLNGIASVWKNLQELDLRPIREAADREIRLSIVGKSGSGRRKLASQLLTDRQQREYTGPIPLLILTPDAIQEAQQTELIVLLLAEGDDGADEQNLLRQWSYAGKKVLVLHNQPAEENGGPSGSIGWASARVLTGSVNDRAFLEGAFASAVIELLPQERLALGRRVPALRLALARQLINEACVANATYSLGTGFAEIVPVLDLPLNVTDMLVLGKGQALLVYKLGLALGLPRDWQYYIGEFGGVIGGAFLWRQLARSLVGLLPGWGIVPKVAIAYAGTFVVGEVVLQWYLTGRHVTSDQMQDMYRQAFSQGKDLARGLASRIPRAARALPRFSRPHIHIKRPGLPAILRRAPIELPIPVVGPVCPACSTQNDPDAVFCKHCGHALAPHL